MSATDRLHALDAIRAFALLLGIVLHATLSFVPGMIPGLWAFVDNSPSTTLSAAFFVTHIFRMTLFFFIAGFFAHLVFHRKGTRAFWSDRAKRILVPLIVGWALLYPAIMAVWGWGLRKTFGGTIPELPAGFTLPDPPPLAFPLTHLWFLYYLLVLYVAVIAARSALVALDRGGRIRATADALVQRLVATGAATVVLALPVAACLYLRESWVLWGGIPTPDQSLIPQLASFIGFGTAVAFGWLAHRQPALLQVWARQSLWHLGIALVATGVCLWISGPAPARPTTTGLLKLGYALCYAVAIWSWVFALTGLAVRFLSNESPVRRYVADASYWLYLAHLPVVAAFQVVVGTWPLHWSVKFPFVVGASLAVLLVSYHWLVRFTFVGAVLNGRKRRRHSADPTRSTPIPPDDGTDPSGVRRSIRGARASGSSNAAPGALALAPDIHGKVLAELGGKRAVLAELAGAHKRYGHTVALGALDLQVRSGELLALLGPNGAGKSTAISLWLGLLEPDAGRVELLGRSPLDIESRRNVGVMMQEVGLAPGLRVREHVALAASYYPCPLTPEAALALTGTTALGDRLYGKLSGGQKRQAQFALALVGRPKLLFLDEPTVGLDVEARATMWAAIRKLVAGGCSIVLTTHCLEEAEALADRVAVLNNGELVADGTVEAIRALVTRKHIKCASALTIDDVRGWPDVIDAIRDAQHLQITATDAEAVVRKLLAADAGLRDLEVKRAGLADAFTVLTKEAA